LEQDEGQNNRIGTQFYPPRLQRSQNRGSDCDSGQQPDENGNHSFPYSPNSVQVNKQHVKINKDFDHNDGRIQDAICIKNERDWHGELRKPIAKGTIYKGRKQSDPGKNDHGGVKRRHLLLLQLPASQRVARGIIAQLAERAGTNAGGRINGSAEDGSGQEHAVVVEMPYTRTGRALQLRDR